MNTKQILLITLILGTVICDIPAHKITGDTSGFTEVT